MEIFDLTKPQSSLLTTHYQSHSSYHQSLTHLQALESMQIAIKTKYQSNSQIWHSSDAVLSSFLKTFCSHQNLGHVKVATWTPASLKLQEGFEVVEISKDPSDWDFQKISQCDFLLMQNPALWNGYFLPLEFIKNALEQIFINSPKLPILIDQRNLVFSWEDPAPIDLSKLNIKNPYCILSSTHPTLAPALEQEVYWTHSNQVLCDHEASTQRLSVKGLVEAQYLVSSFRTRQGPFSQRFQKNALVIAESLKRLSSKLQIMSGELNFKINTWPSCGIYLELCTDSPFSASKLIQKFKSHGVLLTQGKEYSSPKSVMLCYAMHLSQCDRLLKRLDEISRSEISSSNVLPSIS